MRSYSSFGWYQFFKKPTLRNANEDTYLKRVETLPLILNTLKSNLKRHVSLDSFENLVDTHLAI